MIAVRAPLVRVLQQRQEARAVAIEHIRHLRAERPSLRPHAAVLPVRDFIVERPVTEWVDVVEIFARAWLDAVAPGRRRTKGGVL